MSRSGPELHLSGSDLRVVPSWKAPRLICLRAAPSRVSMIASFGRSRGHHMSIARDDT